MLTVGIWLWFYAIENLRVEHLLVDLRSPANKDPWGDRGKQLSCAIIFVGNVFLFRPSERRIPIREKSHFVSSMSALNPCSRCCSQPAHSSINDKSDRVSLMVKHEEGEVRGAEIRGVPEVER